MKNLLLTLVLVPIVYGCAGNTRDQLPIGYVNALDGKFSKTIPALEPKAEKNPDIGLEDRYWLCHAYGMTKNYAKLFPCLDSMQKKLDAGGKEPYWLGGFTVSPYLFRGQAFIELGQYDKAIEQAESGIKYAKKHGYYDDILKFTPEEFLTLLGVAHALSGNIKKAEEVTIQMKNYHFRYGPVGETKDQHLAKLYFSVGNYKEAAAAVSISESALSAIINTVFSSDDLPDATLGLEIPRRYIKFKSLLELGKTYEARVGYDELLAIPRINEFGDMYWNLLSDRGRIALAEGQIGKAIDFYKKSINEIERQRATVNTEAFKIGFVRNKQDDYKNLVSLLISENRPGEAFEYAERAKARALVDMLASKNKLAVKGNDSEATVTALLSDSNKEAGTSIAAIYQRRGISGTRYLEGGPSIRQKLAGIDPETASLISVSVPGVKELQSLLPAGETLIEYFGGGKEFFAFVVDNQSVQAVKLNGEGLHEDVLAFRKWVSPGAGEERGSRNLKRQQADTRTASASAGQLYERLFKPLEPHIRNKNITIVPHDALHYLPFAALNTGRDYLIDRYSIRMLPSASVMKYLRKAAPGKTTTALILGNPDLDNPSFDLPYAEKEATAVGGLIKGSKVFLRKQATKAEVKKSGSSAQFIHFASHGIFKPEHPLESGLALAKDADGNGMLTVGELYEMRLGADLITLSACETALGKIEKGDDVVGITRGFLYAGANTIVSSLWQVDDEATGILMLNFYKQLKKSDKRTALRNAQLSLRNGSKSHPYYWAAFQLTGAN